MRRRAALAALLALAAMALPAAAPAGAGGPAGASPRADCVPTRHSKRVTVRKKVGKKGHRRVIRFKRTRVWWTCEPPPPNGLRVRAREWELSLSRSAVQAGDLRVELSNEGEDPHDLRIERGASTYSFDELEPGGRSEASFPLTPGTWKLYCSLPGHEGFGMSASLTVE